MAKSLFSQIAQAGKALGVIGNDSIQKAREWFRLAASALKGISANDIMQQDQARLHKSRTIGKNQIGQMLLFYYDAKTKEKMPYYDKFPLIFPIELYNDGFLGINLHYLPPVHRAKLMDRLYQLVKDERNAEKKLKISYEILKGASSMGMFRPCVKRYLYNHVRSRYYIVKPEEWDFVLLMPAERFVVGGRTKGRRIDTPYDKSKVWADSMRKINGGKPKRKGK